MNLLLRSLRGKIKSLESDSFNVRVFHQPKQTAKPCLKTFYNSLAKSYNSECALAEAGSPRVACVQAQRGCGGLFKTCITLPRTLRTGRGSSRLKTRPAAYPVRLPTLQASISDTCSPVYCNTMHNLRVSIGKIHFSHTLEQRYAMCRKMHTTRGNHVSELKLSFVLVALIHGDIRCLYI